MLRADSPLGAMVVVLAILLLPSAVMAETIVYNVTDYSDYRTGPTVGRADWFSPDIGQNGSPFIQGGFNNITIRSGLFGSPKFNEIAYISYSTTQEWITKPGVPKTDGVYGIIRLSVEPRMTPFIYPAGFSKADTGVSWLEHVADSNDPAWTITTINMVDYFANNTPKNISPDELVYSAAFANGGIAYDTRMYCDWMEIGLLNGNVYRFNLDAPASSAVPLPAAAWLLGTGLSGLAVLKRKKKG